MSTTDFLTTIVVRDRVLGFLDGSGLFQAPDDLKDHGYGEAGRTLVAKVADGSRLKGGHVRVKLTADEAQVLRDHTEAMRAGAADNTWDVDGRADLRSADALLTFLAKNGL